MLLNNNKSFVFTRLLLVMGSMMLLNSTAWAAGAQTFLKELVGASDRNVGEVVSYELKTACNTLTSDCGDLTITDTLPEGMVIDSCDIPSGFTATRCVAGEKDIEITKDTVFNGGDSVTITIKAQIELDVPPSIIVNSATSTITDPSSPENEALVALGEPVNVIDPVPNWSVSKVRTSPSASLKPTWDTDISYQVKFCSDSAVGNVDLTDVIIEDVFPTNAVVVSTGGGTLTNGNTLTWNLGDIDLATLYASSSYTTQQCITKTYVLRYPDASFNEGDAIQNTVTATGTPTNGGAEINEVDVLDDIIGIPTPGANLSKSANDVLPNEDLNWALYMNINSSNAPVSDLVLYETLQ